VNRRRNGEGGSFGKTQSANIEKAAKACAPRFGSTEHGEGQDESFDHESDIAEEKADGEHQQTEFSHPVG
jgi:hypothetical protein